MSFVYVCHICLVLHAAWTVHMRLDLALQCVCWRSVLAGCWHVGACFNCENLPLLFPQRESNCWVWSQSSEVLKVCWRFLKWFCSYNINEEPLLHSRYTTFSGWEYCAIVTLYHSVQYTKTEWGGRNVPLLSRNQRLCKSDGLNGGTADSRHCWVTRQAWLLIAVMLSTIMPDLFGAV